MNGRLRRFAPWIPAAVAAAAALLFAWRRAWVAEDAYITFRTVDNVLAGIGPRWNPDERVQAYTHPLWMWLLAAAGWLRQDHYLNAIALGLACSAVASLVLVFRLARGPVQAAFAATIVALSGGYVDYSTSGLENSLGHALLAVFWWRALDRAGPLESALLFSAVCLNRLDHAVLCLPALALVVRWGAIGRILAGLAPLAGWTLFSLLYYGSPVPNTAHAKLNAGVPTYDYAAQGLRYFAASADGDPVSIWGPAAVFAAIWLLRPGRIHLVALGAGLYAVYLVRIGGDFMLSRFLTPLVLAAAVTAAAAPLPRMPRSAWAAAFALLAWRGASAPTPTYYVADGTYPAPVGWMGEVNDERRFYFSATGRPSYFAGPAFPRHPFRDIAEKELAAGNRIAWLTNVGIAGWAAGRRIHIIDGYGLGDVLLARIPMAPEPWRPGHFLRNTPEGYYHSIETGENRFTDRALGEYWLKLRRVTRDPLFDRDRLRAVWELNTGLYEPLLEGHSKPGVEIRLAELGSAPIRLEEFRGARVHLGATRRPAGLEVTVEGDGHFFFTYLRGGVRVSARDLADPTGQPPGRRTYRLRPPAYVRWRGFDAVEVRPRRGDGKYWLAGVRLID